MLESIRDIHAGKVFAVLGSAPSVRKFSRKEEIVIGVNGASQLLVRHDYFLSMYKGAHHRSWFQTIERGVSHILRPHSALYSRHLYEDDRFRESLISSNECFMDRYPLQTKREIISGRVVRFVSKEYEPEPNRLCQFPAPKEPHIILREVDPKQRIHKRMTKVSPGGTSACTAIQVAFVMGASEIHLYGVEFTNHTSDNHLNGTNYFYDTKVEEGGRTTTSHLFDADRCILEIRDRGVPVYSHGPTKLVNSIQVPGQK